jgi:hypothetical protein
MSIVIVGIGDADFSSMQLLDDFQDNNDGGRDICQFVEFSKHKHDKRSLTKETLDEIPEQLVDYFFSQGIKPLPPISGSQISLVGSEPDEEDVDLSLDVGADGEISLANYDGPVYDDSKYDTMSTYAPSAPTAPPYQTSTSGYAPQLQSQNHAAAPQAYGQQQMHQSAPAPYGAPQQQYPSQHHSNGPVATGTAVPDSVFHVQVPPGVSPGQQLQVQNPVTHQQLVVTIPQGVQPGGTFAVRY